MTRNTHRLLAVALLASLTVGTGCASKVFESKSLVPWSKNRSKNYATPERVIAVWTDAVYQLPGKPPTRGFGGRIYFYDRQGQVIPVDGQLVVYAFDDSCGASGDERPTRKYAFTSEQLTRYYGESDLGASYSIWIPWDAVGGDEKTIALLPVFVDGSGRMVQGSFATNRLPGKRTLTDEERRGFYVSPRGGPASTAQTHAPSGVQPASYQPAGLPQTPPAQTPGTGLRIHTIQLPPAVSERMARPQASGEGSLSTWPSTDAGAATFPVSPVGAPASYSVPQMPIQSTNTTAPNYSAPNASQQSLGQSGFIGADPQQSISAKSRAWARQDSRSAHFERPRFRVPTAPGAR